MIATFTGRHVNPLDMQDEDLRIEDIAHALALCNRFAGHTRFPISVAQHSIYVMHLCSPEHKLQALLHDASEAYLGDVTKWLKQTLEFAGYRDAEERLQKLIWTAYGCAEEQADEVTQMDQLMVRYEAWRGYDAYPIRHPEYGPPTEEERMLVEPWMPWTWQESENQFLRSFRALQTDRVRV